MQRCTWAESSAAMTAYHDLEWGVPVHDDRRLFEFLILEGMQAGLSWHTILAKRQAFRLAFDHFDPQRVAAYDPQQQAQLLTNPGIIRNRLKIAAAIGNAQAFLRVQQEFDSFDRYLWHFVAERPIQNRFRHQQTLPAQSDVSVKLSHDLRQRGFRFVGPTICYAFMQAIGMVNDHAVECFRHAELFDGNQ